MNQFDAVGEPWWNDRPVFIIGGGPSLRGRDLSGLIWKGTVLGVNRAADFWPCHASFSFDQNFIGMREQSLGAWAAAGQEVFVAVEPDWRPRRVPGVRYLERRRQQGLSSDPRAIAEGKSSGFGALNLAVLKRARRIVLLGYDLQAGGNWHDGYPWGNGIGHRYFDRWAQVFDRGAQDLPAGVEVVNANPGSAIRCFPFTSYDELGIPTTEGVNRFQGGAGAR